MTNQIVDLLDFAFKKYSDKTDLVFDHASISYGDLPYYHEVLMEIDHPSFLDAKIGLDEQGNPAG